MSAADEYHPAPLKKSRFCGKAFTAAFTFFSFVSRHVIGVLPDQSTSQRVVVDTLTNILRIPVRLEVILRPWGLRGSEIRAQPAR